MKRLLLLLLLPALAFIANAQLRMPALFGNGMVLQRDKPVNLWGWAKPGETLTVLFKGQKASAKADKQGKWAVQLKEEPAGGPYELQVQAKSGSLKYTDVLLGEVWLCSGQSNMQWSVNQANNPAEEIAAANYPNIRHIAVDHTVHTTPQADVTTKGWQPATSQYVGSFSAVAYFFARKLYEELKVPIGLVHSSWGGTHVETWTSREAFEKSPEFAKMIAAIPQANLDSLRMARDKEFQVKLQGWKSEIGTAAEQVAWMQPNLDDAGWKTLKVPGFWEQQGLAGLDGTVWYRYHFSLTAQQASETATLHLGLIDDNETTWINGIRIGETSGANTERHYKLPANALRAGDNVLVVKVDDSGGNGGPNGPANALKLQTKEGDVALAGTWKYRLGEIGASSAAGAMGPNDYPTLLYNAMINPLIPYTLRGAIWYQGESNATRAFQYRKSFPLMITDWRSRWGQGDFPFYFVQLASFFAGSGGNKNSGNEWAELREAQTMTLSLPNTGMAVTTDIGNPKDIHPKNKQEVGRRLALQALANTYGQAALVANGPVLTQATPQGGKMILSFANTAGGLVAKDKYGYLFGFELAGADKQWYPAKAWIEGDKVVAFTEAVPQPMAVRYGWTDDASEINLFNKADLPAGPFRTDSWERSTEGRKFRE